MENSIIYLCLKKQKMHHAKKAAGKLFPGEIWLQKEEWGERIFVSSRRKIGDKTNFKDELRDAQILRDTGSTVFLVPEDRKSSGKKYDAIVDGLQMEFKNQNTPNIRTLGNHFLRSRSQAPNVFINLEKSPFSKHKIISTLVGVRNSQEYKEKNKFPEGGILILKIKWYKNLLFLNINNLKNY